MNSKRYDELAAIRDGYARAACEWMLRDREPAVAAILVASYQDACTDLRDYLAMRDELVGGAR